MMTLKLYKNFPINDYADQVAYLKSDGTIDTDKRDKAFDDYATSSSTFTNLSSCDKTRQTIRLNINYYVGNQYNYGCIIEDGHRYYVFLDVVEWVANRTVVLHYTYDYWQTYGHRVKFKKSFVEREHVSDDSFGKHIVDEGLPVDEYKVQSSTLVNGENDGMYFCICASDTTDVISKGANEQKSIGGVCKPSKYEQSTMILFSDDLELVNYYLERMVNENKEQGIQGLYCVPKIAIPSSIQHQGYDWDTGESELKYVGMNNNNATLLSAHVNRPSSIDGYSNIKNNKCFTYPYCFANITNNNGASVKGQFELSNDKSKVDFRYYFTCLEGGNSFGFLYNYDGVTKNFDKSISGQFNIELPYLTNTFSAYMSANANTIANAKEWAEFDYGANKMGFTDSGDVTLGTYDRVLETGKSLLSTNLGVGDVINLLFGTGAYNQRLENEKIRKLDAIDSSLADVKSRANISHGAYTGSAPIIANELGFKMQLITVTSENIQMIDNYFTMFGYKVNIIKKPQFSSRPHWNYIKTAGINIVADIPQDAIKSIKAMFDGGVTLWHNIKNMYDYDLDNRA